MVGNRPPTVDVSYDHICSIGLGQEPKRRSTASSVRQEGGGWELDMIEALDIEGRSG